MENNAYESAVLINAALDDEQIESVISRIQDSITNNGGQVRDIDRWGRKRLAYMVKKSKIGYYAIFRFDAPGELIAKLERAYNLDDHILRFMTISLSDDALEHLEKNKNIAVSEEAEARKPAVEESVAETKAKDESTKESN
jgi:small subunit ribosomal protein S6